MPVECAWHELNPAGKWRPIESKEPTKIMQLCLWARQTPHGAACAWNAFIAGRGAANHPLRALGAPGRPGRLSATAERGSGEAGALWKAGLPPAQSAAVLRVVAASGFVHSKCLLLLQCWHAAQLQRRCAHLRETRN